MNLDAMALGRHGDALVAVAFAAEGYAVAFQRYLPAAMNGRAPVLSLDVMPRDPIAPNGVNERLIVDTVEYARRHGYRAVSLNFAAFRTTLSRTPPARSWAGPQWWLKPTQRTIHLLDPLIQVESLYLFNAKFRPGWLPRTVLIRSWFDLPWFALAAFGLEFALPYDRRRAANGPEPELEPESAEAQAGPEAAAEAAFTESGSGSESESGSEPEPEPAEPDAAAGR
jgi:lysyl-tRNA synthetase, class II